MWEKKQNTSANVFWNPLGLKYHIAFMLKVQNEFQSPVLQIQDWTNC